MVAATSTVASIASTADETAGPRRAKAVEAQDEMASEPDGPNGEV